MRLSVFRYKVNKYDNYRFICFLETNEDFVINNLKYIYQISNNRYAFDIQFGLFDNLSDKGIKYLDKIINGDTIKTNKINYINKKNWQERNLYKLNFIEDDIIGFSSQFKMPKTYKYDIDFINTIEENKIIVNQYNDYLNNYSNKIINTYNKINKNDNDIKEVNPTDYYFAEFLGLETNPKDESELVIDFLEMIFFFKPPIVVRKCEDCGKYFICKSGNTHKCNRIGSDCMTCSERADKIRKQHERNEPIKKLLKKVRDHLRYDEVTYQKFCDENYKKKKELFEKDKEYVEWLLGYFDKNRQQDIINKIDGLEDYLK